jgi:oligoribonuclease NrnB/cAMP/cGMP phosphodiesterase (DHH superfamily)
LRSEIALTRIVTHDDLDGLVSAAIVSFATGIDRFFFAGPVAIQNGRIPTSESDIVCDLPCPMRVGMWFDHHPGNLEDIRLREVDPETVPGRFEAAPSCARVVYEFFKEENDFPEFMADTVSGTDRVDSFDYRTMEEWKEPTVERKLADSLFAAYSDQGGFHTYLGKMVRLLRDHSMAEVLTDPEVLEKVQAYARMEEKSLLLIDQDTSFHEVDTEREVAVIDLTRHNRKPEIIRNAAFIRYPEALAVLMVGNPFRGGKKTTDLSFSMSLSFLMNTREHEKDIGEIMRELNIGDGHAGAAGGRIDCRSKDEMLKVKEQTVIRIIQLWRKMA